MSKVLYHVLHGHSVEDTQLKCDHFLYKESLILTCQYTLKLAMSSNSTTRPLYFYSDLVFYPSTTHTLLPQMYIPIFLCNN